MALKVVVKDLKEIPEHLQELYAQVGDEYILDTDDGDYKARIQEFRNTNIDLNKQLTEQTGKVKEADQLQEMLKQYEGLDPQKARDALEKLQAINEQKLIDAGKLDEVLDQRTQRLRSDYEGQIKALNESLNSTKNESKIFKERLAEVVIDNSLQAAVSRTAAVRQGAMQDILSRGRQVWSINDDGTPVPTGSDGKVMYGKDGKSTLSMEEWAQSMRDEAPYLFEPSKGGGAGGGMGGSSDIGGKVINVGDQDALNASIEDIASGKVSVGGD